jgi:hypothetical protein
MDALQPKNYENVVGFEVLAAAIMKMAVFCVVASCSLIEVYRSGRCPDDGGGKYL